MRILLQSIQSEMFSADSRMQLCEESVILLVVS